MKIIRVKSKNPLAEDFAKSIQSIESQVEFSKLIAVEELLQYMKREGINRSALAERMGVPPSRITKMLSGDSNLTIETLVRAGHAVGAELKQTFVPKGHKVRWIHYASAGKDRRSVEFAAESVSRIVMAPSPTLNNNQPAQKDAEDAA